MAKHVRGGASSRPARSRPDPGVAGGVPLGSPGHLLDRDPGIIQKRTRRRGCRGDGRGHVQFMHHAAILTATVPPVDATAGLDEQVHPVPERDGRRPANGGKNNGRRIGPINAFAPGDHLAVEARYLVARSRCCTRWWARGLRIMRVADTMLRHYPSWGPPLLRLGAECLVADWNALSDADKRSCGNEAGSIAELRAADGGRRVLVASRPDPDAHGRPARPALSLFRRRPHADGRRPVPRRRESPVRGRHGRGGHRRAVCHGGAQAGGRVPARRGPMHQGGRAQAGGRRSVHRRSAPVLVVEAPCVTEGAPVLAAEAPCIDNGGARVVAVDAPRPRTCARGQSRPHASTTAPPCWWSRLRGPRRRRCWRSTRRAPRARLGWRWRPRASTRARWCWPSRRRASAGPCATRWSVHRSTHAINATAPPARRRPRARRLATRLSMATTSSARTFSSGTTTFGTLTRRWGWVDPGRRRLGGRVGRGLPRRG